MKMMRMSLLCIPNRFIPIRNVDDQKGQQRKKILYARRKQMALNYAASEAFTVKSSANLVGDRVPKGTYNKIIREAEEKFELEGGSISKLTILTRL
jgi:hypothetical protein